MKRFPRALAVVSTLVASSSLAQPVGPEFRVNAYTTEYSSPPSVAADTAGNFVVVWSATPGIESQDVNVFGRRYDRNGAPLGGEFQVNSLTTYGGYRPRAAMNPSGEFIVVWVASNTPYTLWGQRYSSSGAPEGGQFRVNATTGYMGAPAVAWNGTGGFVVVWDRGYPGDGDATGVFGQRFGAAGAPLGGEFQVSFATTGAQSHPRVAMDAAGSFVVVWESPDGSGSGIFARHFGDDGTPFSVEFRVNASTSLDQTTPDIAAAANGAFVVAWTFPAGNSIAGRRFDPFGTPLGADFALTGLVVNLNNLAPSVASDPFGNFVVAWQQNYYPFSLAPTSTNDVRAGRVRWNGTPVGTTFLVNSYTTANQNRPSVAWSYDNFVVAWQGYGQDNPSSLGALVYAQRFTPGPHGDANGDGTVNVTDVFYVINLLFAGGPFPFGAIDVNGDGKADVADVFYLINDLFAGGPSPQ